MSEQRFNLGDRVCRNGENFVITSVGPWHRKPDEKPWYGLRGERPETRIKGFKDCWDHELEAVS